MRMAEEPEEFSETDKFLMKALNISEEEIKGEESKEETESVDEDYSEFERMGRPLPTREVEKPQVEKRKRKTDEVEIKDEETEEEIEEEYKVIGETDKSIHVKKGGKDFWICKACGEEFSSPFEFGRHWRSCPKRAEVEESEIGKKPKDYIPTVEEELRSERAKKLFKLLVQCPGVRRENAKWIATMFENTRRLNENPENLYYFLKAHLGQRVNDLDIQYIVRCVFEEQTDMSTSAPLFFDEKKDEKPDFSDLRKDTGLGFSSPLSFHHSSPPFGSPTLTLTVQDLEKLINIIKNQIGTNNIDIEKLKEDIRREIKLEAEIESLKKQLEDYKDMMKNILSGDFIKHIKRSATGKTEWDVTSEIIDKTYEGLRGVGSELAKLNRLLVILLLGKRRGRTDDELLDLVKKYGGEDIIAD